MASARGRLLVTVGVVDFLRQESCYLGLAGVSRWSSTGWQGYVVWEGEVRHGLLLGLAEAPKKIFWTHENVVVESTVASRRRALFTGEQVSD